MITAEKWESKPRKTARKCCIRCPRWPSYVAAYGIQPLGVVGSVAAFKDLTSFEKGCAEKQKSSDSREPTASILTKSRFSIGSFRLRRPRLPTRARLSRPLKKDCARAKRP